MCDASGRIVSVADEGDWMELLVASERIPAWLETIRFGSQLQKRQALKQLLAEVQAKEAYAEEAKAAGCVDILTKLISRSEDDEMVEHASRIIGVCNGSLSGFRKVQEVVYGDQVILIQEGYLGDGLGARVWVAAHTLCRELSECPEVVKKRRVLEIGAGCGLSGLLAHKLGAKEVVLTDYEHKVLLNLQACAAANVATLAHPSPAVARDSGSGAEMQNVGSHAAAEVSGSTPAEELEAASPRWDLDGVRVRHLDWAEAVPSSERGPFSREDVLIGRPKEAADPPTLEAGEKFEVIIGSDLLYEMYHSDLVAAVIAARLEGSGVALISLAIRRQVFLDRFLEQCKVSRLLVSVKQVEVDPESVGIVGREHEYEGGFVMLTITHQ